MANDRDRRIEEIEIRAAESELIANLASSPQARAYNSRLSEELHRIAQSLRSPAAH